MKQKRLHIQIVMPSNQIVGYDEFIKYAVLISNLFTFNLPLVSIERTQKLLIEFLDTTGISFIFPEVKDQSIYTIQEKFVFSEFENASALKKKHILTDTAYKCLVKLYQNLGLNSSDVELAYRKVVDDDFMLSVQLCGGVKQNKDATIKAFITAEHYLEYALIQLVFLDFNNDFISKIDLFKTVPAYFIYTQLISSAKWSKNVLMIFNNSKEFIINIEADGSYMVSYNPSIRSIDDVKEEVGFLTKELLINI